MSLQYTTIGNDYRTTTAAPSSYTYTTATDGQNWYTMTDNQEYTYKYEQPTWKIAYTDETKIKELEDKIDSLRAILFELVANLSNSSYKIKHYDKAFNRAKEELWEQVDKKPKTEKKNEDFLSDEDFDL